MATAFSLVSTNNLVDFFVIMVSTGSSDGHNEDREINQ